MQCIKFSSLQQLILCNIYIFYYINFKNIYVNLFIFFLRNQMVIILTLFIFIYF